MSELVKLAALEAARLAATDANATLRNHWLVVNDWNEASRYQKHSHQMAKKLHQAITHATHGVMPWIRTYW